MSTDHALLLQTLQARFDQHPERHRDVTWKKVRAALDANGAALRSLAAMEATGGEPDVIGKDGTSGQFIFCDCSAESPAGRRSLCYDRAALLTRKEHRPKGSALEMASDLAASLLTEDQYLALQALGEFDRKTSSWLLTPPEVRTLGGAIFGDRRFGRVFVYHNGAESYYAARGFRALLRA